MTTAGPRERLVRSAIALVREHGVEAMGTAELLAHSKTARGSIYQHFPGGKEELVEAATRQAGSLMGRQFNDASSSDPAALMRTIVENMKRGLLEHDYAHGCPIVAAAVAGPEHASAVSAAADVFHEWTSQLATTLTARGIPAAQADGFASLVVSALEGALLRARAARDPRPLDDAGEQLATLAAVLSEGQSLPPNSTSTES